MKRKLKIILIIAIVILLSIICFVGVYQKEEFKYSNKIPDYKLASNLDKIVVANLKPDESVNDVYYDSEGNKVDVTNMTDEEKQKYELKSEPANTEDSLNIENYETSKKIIEKRLEKIGLPEYRVRLDNESGNIQIEFQTHDNDYAGAYYASYVGKVDIVNSKDNKTILSNDDIKSMKVDYELASTTSNSYQVYLNVELNKEGQEKLAEFTKNENTEGETNQEENTVVENTTAENTANEISSEDSTDVKNEEKTLSLKFEDDEVATIEVSKITSNKALKMNIGTPSTTNTTLNQNLNEGAVVSLIAESGKMPVKYSIEEYNEEVSSIITNEQIKTMIYVLIAIIALVSILMIIKYKIKGIFVTISNLGAVSILLTLLRLTNSVISFETISAFLILEIIISLITFKTLKNVSKATNREEIKNQFNITLKEIIDIIVINLVIAVVFTFINWTAISTIGIVMFWGLVSIVIAHMIFARTLLLNSVNK